MGVYADDMRGGVVEIEADAEFETASTIKSFILADLYSQTASGAKSMSDVLTNDAEYYVNGSGMLKSLEPGTPMSVKNLATLMIIVSDNIATNMLIDYLGMNHINATISGLGFKKTRLHRKIADGYSGEGHWPPLGTTTPREYGEFFAMLARGELVSPESSREMISIFKKQHYNSTLTNWLPPYYLDEDNFGNDGTEIYVASKSGSMDDCRNDGGIIGTPYGSYVVAIMTKGFHDRQYHREHESHIYGARVSRLLFDQYLALEGRF
ncbi:MAG: class A beta-lactamase-related serine hydrolase, partial [Synergistaceae bacterium]|jgi:beta-lactamase class A|nr:class A beta-lactamase-related serine hydrolase [Synergistaceae bacterium]